VVVVIGIYLVQIYNHAEKVPIENLLNRIETMCVKMNLDLLKEREVKEIVMRLMSFGILTILDEKKLTSETSVQLFVYSDEIKAAYDEHRVYKTYEEDIEAHEID
jgi:Cdc6-like AAA superfamily ATPase